MIEQVNETTFAVDIGGSLVEIGNKDATKFEPHIMLPRWDGECKFRLLMPSNGVPNVELSESKERLQWRLGDMGLDWYTLPPTEQHDGALEQEITLFSRPPSNELRFPFEADELNLYHQPKLTQEEVALGASRPDNVVNSIAIHHSTKRWHEIGKTNYRAGNAFHLYRGQAIDSNGWRVWVDKFLDHHEIVYVIPYDFWLNAKYPVHHALGDTFGYTDKGGSKFSLGDTILALICTGAAGIATKLTAYIECTFAGKNGKGAIYQSDNIITNGATDEVESPVADDAVDYPFSTPPTIAAETYWLACWGDTDGGAHNLRYNSNGYSIKYESSGNTSYNGWPNPWETHSEFSNYNLSIYCTYTPSGPPVSIKRSSFAGII